MVKKLFNGGGGDISTRLNKIGVTTLLASAAIGVAAVGYVSMTADEHDARTREVRSELATVKNNIESIENALDDMTVETVKSDLNSAKVRGDEIAELQNTWGELTVYKN